MFSWRFLLAAILVATFVANNDGAVLLPKARASLSWGYASYGDRLLSRSYAYKQPILGAIQSEDIVFRENATTYITAIYVTEVGYTQYGTAWLISGGIGQRNATIRIQSSYGYGYNYVIDIWGR